MREHRRQPLRRHPRLVVVEQRVVPHALVPHRVRLSRASPKIARARARTTRSRRSAAPRPTAAAPRRHARPLLDEPARHPPLLVELAPDLPHVHRRRALRIAHERRAFDRRRAAPRTAGPPAVVHHPREERPLLGAMLHAVARHARLPRPTPAIETRREQRLLAREADDLLVCLLGFMWSRTLGLGCR